MLQMKFCNTFKRDYGNPNAGDIPRPGMVPSFLPRLSYIPTEATPTFFQRIESVAKSIFSSL